VLLPVERDPFWDDLVAALKVVGSDRGLTFEVTRYAPTGANAQDVLEKTALSQVDALVCYPPDSGDVTDVINAAESRGLPVLLLDHDLPNSRRRVFLGTSDFQMGQQVGLLIAVQVPGARRAGVLVSQANVGRQSVKNSLFINGLNDALSQARREVTLQEVVSPPGRFAGEELVWNLLRREPGVQVLVTTNPKDTSGALQTIVEANKVGKTKLVGVGEDPALRTALSQGLISGLIVRDANEWAALVATTLEAVFGGQPVSSYVTLPIHALSAGEVFHGN
jgi:ribose transport system substrate-binding protein